MKKAIFRKNQLRSRKLSKRRQSRVDLLPNPRLKLSRKTGRNQLRAKNPQQRPQHLRRHQLSNPNHQLNPLKPRNRKTMMKRKVMMPIMTCQGRSRQHQRTMIPLGYSTRAFTDRSPQARWPKHTALNMDCCLWRKPKKFTIESRKKNQGRRSDQYKLFLKNIMCIMLVIINHSFCGQLLRKVAGAVRVES